jgi:aldehyde:ferredoxin oxidoreductase
MIGSTGKAEPRFLNAVTGKNFTFLDGIELGRKIWNLDQAIWTLQGRHRDMVHFADYIYRLPKSTKNKKYIGRENGEWTYIDIIERHVDREKFEEFKTLFYELEGWDPLTGYPTRSSLENLDLGYVADELEEQNKLGSG